MVPGGLAKCVTSDPDTQVGLEPDQPLYRILVAEDKASNRQL
jgi:hypothetical protein